MRRSRPGEAGRMQHNPLLLALLALVLSAASTTVVHAQQELALGSQLGPGQPDGQQQEQRVVLQPGRNVALPQRIPLAVGGSPGQGAGVTVFAIVGNISSSPSQPGSRQPCMAVLDLRQLLPPLDNATDVPSSTTLAAVPLFSVSPNTTLRMQSLSLWLPRNTTPSTALPVVDRNALSLQAYLGAVLAQLSQYSVLTPSLLQLVNVTLVEPRCGRLQRLQNYTCMQPAWGQWEVGTGYMFIPSFSSSQLSVTNLNITCEATATPAATCDSGNSSNSSNSSNSNNSNGPLTLPLVPPCVSTSVGSWRSLLLALLSLQPQAPAVTIKLVANITVPYGAWAAALASITPRSPPPAGQRGSPFLQPPWPSPPSPSPPPFPSPDSSGDGGEADVLGWGGAGVGVAGVTLYRRVTLTGMPQGVGAPTLLDLGLNLDMMTLDPVSGCLVMQNLIVLGLAVGKDDHWPAALLAGAMWAVNYDRTTNSRIALENRNCTVVVPSDLYLYLATWLSRQDSHVPQVRATAAWMKQFVFLSIDIGDADDHHLYITTRTGQGTVWYNVVLTDLVPWVPVGGTTTPLPPPNTGISQLSTVDPYAKLSDFQPVFSGDELLAALSNASSPYIVVMQDMQLFPTAAATANATANATAAATAATAAAQSPVLALPSSSSSSPSYSPSTPPAPPAPPPLTLPMRLAQDVTLMARPFIPFTPPPSATALTTANSSGGPSSPSPSPSPSPTFAAASSTAPLTYTSASSSTGYPGLAVLDLGFRAGLLQITPPARLTLLRLYLTGLAPATPVAFPPSSPSPASLSSSSSSSPPSSSSPSSTAVVPWGTSLGQGGTSDLSGGYSSLANLTAALWAASFPRSSSLLHLVNCTLNIPPSELLALQYLLLQGNSSSPAITAALRSSLAASAPAAPAPVSPAATALMATMLSPPGVAGAGGSVADGVGQLLLSFSQLSLPGLQGEGVQLSGAPPPSVTSNSAAAGGASSVTFSNSSGWGDVVLALGNDSPSPPSPPPGEVAGAPDAANLGAIIGGVAGGCVLLLVVAVIAVWAVQRRRFDRAIAEKEASLASASLADSGGAAGGGGQHSNSNWIRGMGTPSSGSGVTVLLSAGGHPYQRAFPPGPSAAWLPGGSRGSIAPPHLYGGAGRGSTANGHLHAQGHAQIQSLHSGSLHGGPAGLSGPGWASAPASAAPSSWDPHFSATATANTSALANAAHHAATGHAVMHGHGHVHGTSPLGGASGGNRIGSLGTGGGSSGGGGGGGSAGSAGGAWTAAKSAAVAAAAASAFAAGAGGGGGGGMPRSDGAASPSGYSRAWAGAVMGWGASPHGPAPGAPAAWLGRPVAPAPQKNSALSANGGGGGGGGEGVEGGAGGGGGGEVGRLHSVGRRPYPFVGQGVMQIAGHARWNSGSGKGSGNNGGGNGGGGVFGGGGGASGSGAPSSSSLGRGGGGGGPAAASASPLGPSYHPGGGNAVGPSYHGSSGNAMVPSYHAGSGGNAVGPSYHAGGSGAAGSLPGGPAGSAGGSGTRVTDGTSGVTGFTSSGVGTSGQGAWAGAAGAEVHGGSSSTVALQGWNVAGGNSGMSRGSVAPPPVPHTFGGVGARGRGRRGPPGGLGQAGGGSSSGGGVNRSGLGTGSGGSAGAGSGGAGLGGVGAGGAAGAGVAGAGAGGSSRGSRSAPPPSGRRMVAPQGHPPAPAPAHSSHLPFNPYTTSGSFAVGGSVVGLAAAAGLVVGREGLVVGGEPGEELVAGGEVDGEGLVAGGGGAKAVVRRASAPAAVCTYPPGEEAPPPQWSAVSREFVSYSFDSAVFEFKMRREAATLALFETSPEQLEQLEQLGQGQGGQYELLPHVGTGRGRGLPPLLPIHTLANGGAGDGGGSSGEPISWQRPDAGLPRAATAAGAAAAAAAASGGGGGQGQGQGQGRGRGQEQQGQAHGEVQGQGQELGQAGQGQGHLPLPSLPHVRRGTATQNPGALNPSTPTDTPRGGLDPVQGMARGSIGATPGAELESLVSDMAPLTAGGGLDSGPGAQAMQAVVLEQVLGQGSFGVVYKGKWRSMTVAVKALLFHDASSAKRVRQRALTEAAINQVLSHDNIVNTYAYDLRNVKDAGLPDGALSAHWKLYIIQEFCDGGNLAHFIDRGFLLRRRPQASSSSSTITTSTAPAAPDALPTTTPGPTSRNQGQGQGQGQGRASLVEVDLTALLQLAHDVALGLAYIHSRRVIHGDLSPGNVMLKHSARALSCWQAKVGDFGLSRCLGEGRSHISNARQGTPMYIAPEILTHGHISQPADIFSFGAVLREMWCGTPPWRTPHPSTLTGTGNTGGAGPSPKPPAVQPVDALSYDYSLPFGAPPALRALVAACVSKEPKERPSAAALADMLGMMRMAYKRKGMDGLQLPGW